MSRLFGLAIGLLGVSVWLWIILAKPPWLGLEDPIGRFISLAALAVSCGFVVVTFIQLMRHGASAENAGDTLGKAKPVMQALSKRWRSWLLITCLLIIGALLRVWLRPSPVDKFHQIAMGMSKEQVVAIIGDEEPIKDIYSLIRRLGVRHVLRVQDADVHVRTSSFWQVDDSLLRIGFDERERVCQKELHSGPTFLQRLRMWLREHHIAV
jgi:hypothetical protein